MAFNVNDYIKPASKPFANRIIDPIISGAIAGRPNSTNSVASFTATNMLVDAGVSKGSIESTSVNTVTNTVSTVADAFYALAGVNIARATRASLMKSRYGRMNTNDYLANSDPATRISKSRKDDTLQIIAVV